MRNTSDAIWASPILLGGDVGRSASEAIIQKFWTPTVALTASAKFSQTLGDRDQHSCMLIQTTDDILHCLILHFHCGAFHDVACRLHGTILKRMGFPICNTDDVSCVVMFDFFVEDLNERPEVSLAVSFLPRIGDRLPPDLRFRLVHREMLSDGEWAVISGD